MNTNANSSVDTQRYRNVIDVAKDLPTLSTVVMRLNEMIASPTTSAADVGSLISQDLALTGKTLKLVNSSFYGFPKKINSIIHAIVILGFNKVKNIALSVSVLQAFKKTPGKGFDYFGFWEHTIATAISAEVIARNLKSAYQEEAFVAGLLHDIGKLLLVQYFPDEYGKVRELIDREKITMFQAENEVIGFNHSLIGLWIAEKWNFPEPLCMAIRMHHNPLMARAHRELVLTVHVADIFARALGIGNGGDPYLPELEQTIWDQLRLNTTLADKIMAEILDGVNKAGDFLDLVREKS